ncbi:ORF6N domain-containing protein [archaeon]|nr:ORF6N domain-containing protein [archaeon]
MLNKKIVPNNINNKIHSVRGYQVMLDRDLAILYQVPTKALNQAVKRNSKRFPSDFMFQLTELEKIELVTNCDHLLKLKYSPSLPHVFTEHGIAALSGILKSKIAVEVNIHIIRTFVAMRKFISKNTELFGRLGAMEQKQLEYQIITDQRLEQVFEAIEDTSLIKKQGIFYNGQVFDAYKFISDLIRSAKKSIVLIDNYIDDTVLILFSKRKSNVEVVIYTNNISKQLELDLDKYNSQYSSIIVKEFKDSHDRFLIIDGKEVYHIGASLKDLGEKWFAFSKFDEGSLKMLKKLKK